MKINKNNYQEFLLLYIDGELNEVAQKEVEYFIEQNENIKQELDLLLDTKLQFEDIQFGDISSLLKNEDNEIGLKNYEENFCLYVDNELSKIDKKKVETYVLQHPNLQVEFTTLNKTKLPVQTIEYPNKKELYKKEKSIIFYLQRVAVAAVFIGLMAFVWNLFDNKKESEITKISGIKTEEKNIITNNKIENKIVKNNVIIHKNKTENIVNNKALEKDIKAIKNEIVKNNKIENIKNQTPNAIEQKNEVVINQTTNHKQETALEKNNQTLNFKPQTSNSLTQNIVSDKQETRNEMIAVVYKNLEDEEDNAISKTTSKIKGLFKKATKLVNSESNTDNDSRKLFAVTLK